MKKNRSVQNLMSVIFFALLGNCIGARIYKARTGKPASWLMLNYVDENNNRYMTTPVLTNFLPALCLGLLVKPHRLVSLLAGMVSTALLGDEIQKRVMVRVAARLEEKNIRRSESLS